MSLRKIAGLLAAAGLVAGLLGTGVGAQFTDFVTAQQNINVGTFSCAISDATAGATYGAYDGAGHPHTVTYNSPQIASSAAGNAPFTFTVKNWGSIDQNLVITAGALTGTLNASKFSAIALAPASPVALAHGAAQPFTTGIQWTALDNSDLGTSGSVTWTVNCGEPPVPAVIFDNTAPVLAPNYPSYGAQAYSFDEWGGGVTFAGTARKLAAATVTLSSWACETGSWDAGTCASTPGHTYAVPITFNVYSVTGGVVGGLIATKTQTFAIPYRPSAATAAECAGDTTAWYDVATAACYHGKAVNVTFAFAGETVPNTAVFGITYQTTSSGYPVLGAGSHPTDSLNIATYPGNDVATEASVGTWLPNDTSSYLTPRGGGSSLTGRSPVANMPTGPADNFVSYMPAVQITAN